MKPVSVKLKDGPVIAGQAWMTEDVTERIGGWLQKKEAKPGEGLLIAPCASIHTFGMSVVIDAVFLDESLQVTKIWSRLRPNRLAAGTFRNLLTSWKTQVLELPEGAAKDLKVGDRLEISSRNSDAKD